MFKSSSRKKSTKRYNTDLIRVNSYYVFDTNLLRIVLYSMYMYTYVKNFGGLVVVRAKWIWSARELGGSRVETKFNFAFSSNSLHIFFI